MRTIHAVFAFIFLALTIFGLSHIFVNDPTTSLFGCNAPLGPRCHYSLAPTTPVIIATTRDPSRGNRKTGVITEAWPYCYDPDGRVFVVGAGFDTDFASIPGWARGYVNPTADYAIEPAIVHDWLYAVGEAGDEDARLYADKIFRYILSENGVNKVRRNIMFQAVRLGGADAFGRSEELRIRPVSRLSQGVEVPLRSAEILAAPLLEVKKAEYPQPVDTLLKCEGFYSKYIYDEQGHTRVLRVE